MKIKTITYYITVSGFWQLASVATLLYASHPKTQLLSASRYSPHKTKPTNQKKPAKAGFSIIYNCA